jgi:UDP-N-acetylenolpyruvoylglucosamine reductase
MSALSGSSRRQAERGLAHAADIMALARLVQHRVHDAFGIDLAIEPTLVGNPG